MKDMILINLALWGMLIIAVLASITSISAPGGNDGYVNGAPVLSSPGRIPLFCGMRDGVHRLCGEP